MTITKTINNAAAAVQLEGRLDTTTAPELEKELDEVIASGINELVLDLKGLEYTSSAGLRVLLKEQKVMNTRGGMKITNVSEEVMEVFEITGFVDILTIE